MPSALTSIVALIGAGIVFIGFFTGLAAIGSLFSLLMLMMEPNTFGQLNHQMQAAALNTAIFTAVTAAVFKVGTDIVKAA